MFLHDTNINHPRTDTDQQLNISCRGRGQYVNDHNNTSEIEHNLAFVRTK
jgi:hypothetical protein